MQQINLVGEGMAYNSYLGIVKVSVSEFGIVFELMPVISLFHPPILIPFEDLNVQPISWYINCQSYKLSTANVPSIEIVITDDLKGWLASFCQAKS